MAYIYFSRQSPPHPILARALVSGVVEAATPDEAKAKLDALLTKGGKAALEQADEFSFLALDDVERTDHGVLAITMRDDG